MPRQRATADLAYERVLSNLKTAQLFTGHALAGLPDSPSARAAIQDVADELVTAVEMVEEVQRARLLGHLEVLADALALPGKGSE